jgi:hypothetical protein
MEMKGALTLPRDEFWYDTAVALMKGKEEEILAEKGDLEYPPGTILPEGQKKTYRSASVIEEEGGDDE